MRLCPRASQKHNTVPSRSMSLLYCYDNMQPALFSQDLPLPRPFPCQVQAAQTIPHTQRSPAPGWLSCGLQSRRTLPRHPARRSSTVRVALALCMICGRLRLTRAKVNQACAANCGSRTLIAANRPRSTLRRPHQEPTQRSDSSSRKATEENSYPMRTQWLPWLTGPELADRDMCTKRE